MSLFNPIKIALVWKSHIYSMSIGQITELRNISPII